MVNSSRTRRILLILIGVLPASCSLFAPSDAELRDGNDGAGDCTAGVGALGGGAGAGNAVWGWTGGAGIGGEAGSAAGAHDPSLGGTASSVQ